MNLNPAHGPSATPSLKSVVFRVRGISIDGRNDAELKSALSAAINSRLVGNERLEIEVSVDIVASCYSPEKMVGLVDFRGGVPSFLSSALKDPQKELQMVMGEADITFDCNFFDFTQLYNVKQPINADVIAITGLDGHAYGSWRGKGPLSRMWLRDFLSKDLPHSRVMTYGYNSKLTGGSRGLERILDYGRNFIEDIKQIRSTDKEMRRPLIFIAHSFGGIILAHSMIKAVLSRDKRSEMIYAATYGILFFGTPHKGLLVDDIRRLVAGNDHPRHDLLDQIQLKSDALSNQLADFRNIIEDRKIVSFYETEQTRQLAFNSETVRWERTGEFITAVDIDSALLHLPDTVEKKLPIRANHSTIVKFDSKEDGGYRTAITLLQKFEDDAPQTVEARFAQHQVIPTKSTPSTGAESSTHVTSEFQEPRPGSTEMEFTQSNVECLSMRAYELFVQLKDMSDDVHLTLKKLNVPLFSFKCALDHLSRRVNILLTHENQSKKLDATVSEFATTISSLQSAIERSEHLSVLADENTVSILCTNLDCHATTAQVLIDKVFGSTSTELNTVWSRTGSLNSTSRAPVMNQRFGSRRGDLCRVPDKNYPNPVKQFLQLDRPAPHDAPGTGFFTMMASPVALAAHHGPILSSSAQLSDLSNRESQEVRMDTEMGAEEVNVAEQSIGTLDHVSRINRRRAIASADAERRIERQSGRVRRIPPILPFQEGTTTVKPPAHIASPGEWAERLRSVLPPKLSSRRESPKELIKWLRQLNIQISGITSKPARRNFRDHLEKNGQFSEIMTWAKTEFGVFAQVRKELEVYQDDKEDDM